jgi:hypothetical protein
VIPTATTGSVGAGTVMNASTTGIGSGGCRTLVGSVDHVRRTILAQGSAAIIRMNRKIFYWINHLAECALANGGIQRVTRRLGRALADVRHEVVFTTWSTSHRAATRASGEALRRFAVWNGPSQSQQGDGRPLDQSDGDRGDLAGHWLIVPQCPYHGMSGDDPTLAMKDRVRFLRSDSPEVGDLSVSANQTRALRPTDGISRHHHSDLPIRDG